MTETHPQTQRAVIYARVSSVRQLKEGDGLASQETRCREYARHKGYEIAHIFRDEGVSGGMIDRPGMQSMLRYLRKHSAARACIVIIDDISRLARGLNAHLELRTAIGNAGGKLESPSIEFGDDSDSILVENLLASVSQHQRQKNAEQVVNRMRARFMNGYYVFQCPIGYRYERVSGHGKMLVPDEPAASTLREVLEGFASGRFTSQVEVKRYLDQFHPAFASKFTGEIGLQKTRELLERPLYAGLLDAPKWNIFGVQGKHEALISLETHQKILERLRKPAPVDGIRADTSADFPLRGLVACGTCGNPMTAAWSKGRNARYPYYFCQTKNCADRRRSIRKEKIEGEFAELLETLRPARPVLSAFEAILKDAYAARAGGTRSGQKEMKAEIGKLEKKIALVMERLISCDDPALTEAYEEQVRGLQMRKRVLKEKSTSSGNTMTSFEETYRTAITFLENPRKLWDSEHLILRRIVPKLLFDLQ